MRKIIPLIILIFVPANYTQTINGSYSSYGADKKSELRIDHINIVVDDLSKSKKLFELLGFSIKPGRVHKNSIDNLHMKFKDGTEIELITASKPLDNLSEEYLELLKKGSDGAFFALQTDNLISKKEKDFRKLYPVKINYENNRKTLEFDKNYPLRFIWFIENNGKHIFDKKQYITHRNNSQRLSAVWLSKRVKQIGNLFVLLDYTAKATDFPEKGSGRIHLNNGDIYLMNFPLNKINRPIVGATIKVDAIDKTRNYFKKNNIPFTEQSNDSCSSIFISNDFTKNIILEFRETFLKQ